MVSHNSCRQFHSFSSFILFSLWLGYFKLFVIQFKNFIQMFKVSPAIFSVTTLCCHISVYFLWLFLSLLNFSFRLWIVFLDFFEFYIDITLYVTEFFKIIFLNSISSNSKIFFLWCQLMDNCCTHLILSCIPAFPCHLKFLVLLKRALEILFFLF